MGTGDWNDGMNKVGAEGKGESVWNGWFFISVLNAFAKTAKTHGDGDRAAWCEDKAEALRVALETNAWDGAWYRRAYFDDGTPLGSSQNAECQIDAIPQAWAVISGVADAKRAQVGNECGGETAGCSNDKLIQLFDPPFDKGSQHPGYIKGYVPGIRENGGQYTHAATWVVLATALQGDGDRALELWNYHNPIYHATTPVGGSTIRSSRMWYAPTSMVHHRTRVAAAGRGTPVRRVGYIASHSRRSSASSCKATGSTPCIPRDWPSFEMSYRYRTTNYRIRVDNSGHTGRAFGWSCWMEGPFPDGTVLLRDDGETHEVHVGLG